MSFLTLTYKHNFKKAPIVSLNGEPVLLFNQQQHTLLEVLEIKKVNVFSECRNGFCGACKTTVNKGSVSYITKPLVELKDNECLPCCCVPDSNLDLDLTTDEPSNLYVQHNKSVVILD
ncbi:class I ribonucleotide reductase maintenance protein YfaE [Shewanella goraebulensis]|uniref:class I ribonucleotide reductase maintenance protein YfaE n=1 Tax=Shewanella goraebulensis TaxID=3050637 RepID=UPI00254AC011|nr:class I ribonucleotide reductase maintenance protein YfaE [Shewanella goraebulensis]